MSKQRIESWSDFPAETRVLDDGRVFLKFPDGRWAMLKPMSLGISLTSFVSLYDALECGVIDEVQFEGAVAEDDARKVREQQQGEQAYRDAMLMRQERLR